MPVEMKVFKALPKVVSSKVKGGKKADWGKVLDLMRGKGGFTVKEVHELTIKAATVELEKNKETGKTIPPVSKFRTGRWLQGRVAKGIMEVRQQEDGAYVYLVVGIEIPTSAEKKA